MSPHLLPVRLFQVVAYFKLKKKFQCPAIHRCLVKDKKMSDETLAGPLVPIYNCPHSMRNAHAQIVSMFVRKELSTLVVRFPHLFERLPNWLSLACRDVVCRQCNGST